MIKNKTKKMVTAALLMAVGIILPFITMQIPAIGNMLLPMHIPVILCGFLCGGGYGLAIGLVLPILRSFLFGMPPLMPIGTAMAFELAAYGLVSGLLYRRFSGKKCGIYMSLIAAMLAGRVVWGLISFGLFTMLGNPFTWQIFFVQAVVNAIPGIILQLILIPVIIYAVKGRKIVEE